MKTAIFCAACLVTVSVASAARANCNSTSPCYQQVNSATNGIGLYGADDHGTGVYGWSDASNGLMGITNTGKAVHGIAQVDSGLGGHFTHTGAGIALYGEANNGWGVYGWSTSNTGVIGITDTGHAVQGIGQGSGSTGGYFKSTSSAGTALVVENTNGGTAVWVSGNGYYTGSWTQWSDARLKKDIRDLPYGLSQALKLRPVMYKLKEGDDRTRIGLIAQEVQKVVPEVVSTDPSKGNGMLGVDYISLLPLSLRAVQEQQTIIERLEARVANLERARSPVTMSSVFGGGAALGLLPLGIGIALASRRRKSGASSEPTS